MRNLYAISIMLALLCTNVNADGCHIDRQASLPITFNSFVPTVPAHINSQLVSIGVDTGSSSTILTPEAAARLNLPSDSDKNLDSNIGVHDHAYIERFEFGHAIEMMKKVSVIAIGGSRPALQTSDSAPAPNDTMTGLVGTETLSDYDVEFRFPAHILNLYRVTNCAKVMPPWEGHFASVPVSISATKRFIVPLELDGHPLTAIFDTGASGLRISRAAAQRIGITDAMLEQDPTHKEIRPGNITDKVPFHKFDRLTIGRETFSAPRITVVDYPLTESDMLIGETYMRSRRFWLSYATKTLFIQPHQERPLITNQVIPAN